MGDQKLTGRFDNIDLQQPTADAQISRFRKTLLENIKEFCAEEKLSVEKTSVAELLDRIRSGA